MRVGSRRDSEDMPLKNNTSSRCEVRQERRSIHILP